MCLRGPLWGPLLQQICLSDTHCLFQGFSLHHTQRLQNGWGYLKPNMWYQWEKMTCSTATPGFRESVLHWIVHNFHVVALALSFSLRALTTWHKTGSAVAGGWKSIPTASELWRGALSFIFSYFNRTNSPRWWTSPSQKYESPSEIRILIPFYFRGYNKKKQNTKTSHSAPSEIEDCSCSPWVQAPCSPFAMVSLFLQAALGSKTSSRLPHTQMDGRYHPFKSLKQQFERHRQSCWCVSLHR